MVVNCQISTTARAGNEIGNIRYRYMPKKPAAIDLAGIEQLARDGREAATEHQRREWDAKDAAHEDYAGQGRIHVKELQRLNQRNQNALVRWRMAANRRVGVSGSVLSVASGP